MGTLYQRGLGVGQDASKAFALYKTAADQGDPNGQVYLGIRYENGDGVAKDAEITGEASILLAQTCFPNDGITGNVGHGPNDVACMFPSTWHFPGLSC